MKHQKYTNLKVDSSQKKYKNQEEIDGFRFSREENKQSRIRCHEFKFIHIYEIRLFCIHVILITNKRTRT